MHLLAGFGGGTCFGRRTEKRIVFHLAAEVGTTVAAFAKRLVGSFSRDHLLALLADRGRERRPQRNGRCPGFVVRRVCGLCGDKPVVILVILSAFKGISCSINSEGKFVVRSLWFLRSLQIRNAAAAVNLRLISAAL